MLGMMKYHSKPLCKLQRHRHTDPGRKVLRTHARHFALTIRSAMLGS